MGWASFYIEALQKGEFVMFRPRGNSMTGKINNGQLVTVEPLKELMECKVGDVVLCKVNGREFLHLIKGKKGQRYLIGNNKGRINGWTDKVYGKVTKVED